MAVIAIFLFGGKDMRKEVFPIIIGMFGFITGFGTLIALLLLFT